MHTYLLQFSSFFDDKFFDATNIENKFICKIIKNQIKKLLIPISSCNLNYQIHL